MIATNSALGCHNDCNSVIFITSEGLTLHTCSWQVMEKSRQKNKEEEKKNTRKQNQKCDYAVCILTVSQLTQPLRTLIKLGQIRK